MRRGASPPLVAAALFALLAATMSLPASALQATPERPVAGQPASLQVSGGAATEIEVLSLREAPLAPLAGAATGPHLHAPRLGGNFLHIPSADAADVRATGPNDTTAAVGVAVRTGPGWRVPITFPTGGAWTVVANGVTFDVEVPSLPVLARTQETPASAVLFAVESPLRPVAPETRFFVQIYARPSGGAAWTPLADASVGMSYGGGATLPAEAVAPGRYAATLPTAADSPTPFFTVNVTAAGVGAAHAGFTLRVVEKAATVGGYEGGRIPLTFHYPASFLVLAHDWEARSHATLPVEVTDGASATPQFASVVPLVLDARWKLTWGDGAPILDPGSVHVVRESAAGNATPVAAAPDGRGNVSATIEFPAEGSYRLRLVAPSLGIDRAFAVEASPSARSGDEGTGTGAPPDEEAPPWWRSIPAPALLAAAAAAVAAVAAGGRRRR